MNAYIAALLLLTFVSTNAQEPEVVASWTLATSAPPVGFPGAAPDGGPVHSPNAIFIGVQATQDRFFIALPRFQPGQPLTFGWVPKPAPGQQLPLDTPINPFPDWEWHRAAAGGAQSASANCSGLVSVFHSKLDKCGRLWVLDSGVSDAQSNFTRSCPPKILAFNATTGQVLHRHVFGSEVIEPYTLFANFALEDLSPEGSCSSDIKDLFIYIADTRSPGIAVYDVQKGSAWRHDPPQAYADPDHGVYTIQGQTFVLMDAVIGLTVSLPKPTLPVPNRFEKESTLYFQAFASDRIFSVPTEALKAQPIPNELLPIKEVAKKSSQCNPIIINPEDGSLVISPVTETIIKSIHPLLKTISVKAFSPKLIQGVTDIQVVPKENIIYALSARIQKFFTSTASPNEVNIRILKIQNNL